MTEQKRNKGEITAAEAGRRGGQSTLQRKGIGFFKKIGKKGGKRTKELYGHGCPTDASRERR
jgi:general stress protein YciG